MKIDVWQKVWENYQFDPKNDLWELNWEKSQPRWKLALQYFQEKWGGLKNRTVVELGCGRATEALLAAREGSKVTLVDNNKTALYLAKQRFEHFGLGNTLQLIQSDVLNLDKKILGKFDICMSLGLVEHFMGRSRQKVITAHGEVLRSGGVAMISVPNSWSIPYRLWTKREKILNHWQYGLEIPFSPEELRKTIEKARLKPINMVGSSIFNDILVLFVPPRFKKIRSFNYSTPFDSKLGHILTILAQRE